MPADERGVLLAQQQFEPVGCSDDRAVAEITTIGATSGAIGGMPEDEGCPPDSDLVVRAENFEGLSSRIVCARNLEPPHPGDAGQGGGELMEGDCLVVGGGTSPEAFQVGEAPCSTEGWFGTVAAVAATPDECPDSALSRITSPFVGGPILCAGPDGPRCHRRHRRHRRHDARRASAWPRARWSAAA